MRKVNAGLSAALTQSNQPTGRRIGRPGKGDAACHPAIDLLIHSLSRINVEIINQGVAFDVLFHYVTLSVIAHGNFAQRSGEGD
jgi:hypothetical protein